MASYLAEFLPDWAIRAALADPTFEPTRLESNYYLLRDDGRRIPLKAVADYCGDLVCEDPKMGRYKTNAILFPVMNAGFVVHAKKTTQSHSKPRFQRYVQDGLLILDSEPANDFDIDGIPEGVVAESRAIAWRKIRARPGQARFRERLIVAYGGRCAVTGEGPPEVLEAAHIIPVKDRGADDIRNGLLLRSDIHRLFDLGLWWVDSADHKTIRVHETLAATWYATLEGREIRQPANESSRAATAFWQVRLEELNQLDC